NGRWGFYWGTQNVCFIQESGGHHVQRFRRGHGERIRDQVQSQEWEGRCEGESRREREFPHGYQEIDIDLG
ncbi:MAG: hypothetical protein L0G59_05575, partial [Kocuria sp.]|nr:hypothetical protein [Kocuria sp.]